MTVENALGKVVTYISIGSPLYGSKNVAKKCLEFCLENSEYTEIEANTGYKTSRAFRKENGIVIDVDVKRASYGISFAFSNKPGTEVFDLLIHEVFSIVDELEDDDWRIFINSGVYSQNQMFYHDTCIGKSFPLHSKEHWNKCFFSIIAIAQGFYDLVLSNLNPEIEKGEENAH